MQRVRLAMLLTLDAVISTLYYVFAGSQVAPCLGLGDNAECATRWREQQGVFGIVADTPIPALVLFLLLTLLTLALRQRQQVRRDRGRG